MPTYRIAGKTIRTEVQLTEADIEAIAKDLQGPATPTRGVDPDVPTPENIEAAMQPKRGKEYLTREYLTPLDTAIETIPMVTGAIGSFYGPVGATFGGTGGELLRQAIRGEADLTKAAQTGVTEGLLTKGGQIVERLLGPLLPTPSVPQAVREADLTQRTLQEGSAEATLTAAQAGQTGLPALLERLSRGSIFGGGVFDDVATKNLDSLSGQLDDIVTARTGREVSLEETGLQFYNVIQQGYDNLKSGYESVTTAIWNRVPGSMNGATVRDDVAETIATHTAPVSGDASAIGGAYNKAVQIINKLPDNPTAQQVNENLKLLRGLERGASKEMGANTQEIIKISELIDAAENSFAKQLKGVKAIDDTGKQIDLFEQFADAQKKYGKYKSELFPEILTPLMRSADKDAFQAIGVSLSKPGVTLDQVKAAKTALERAGKLNRSLDTDAALAAIQESYVRGLFGNPQSLQEIAGVAKQLSGSGGKAKVEAMTELLGEATTNRIRAIAKAAEDTVSGTKGSGVLQLSVGSRQVGAFETIASGTAATQLFTGDPSTAFYAAGILFAPAFIAKAATNPKITNFVIKTLKNKRPLPAKVASQLLTRAVYELGMDPFEFEGTMIEPNTLRQRLDDLDKQEKKTRGSAFTGETLAEGA